MKNKEQEAIELYWNQFFSMALAPFGGNCFVLLKVTDGRIAVQAAAVDLDSMKFLIAAPNEKKDERPDYMQ